MTPTAEQCCNKTNGIQEKNIKNFYPIRIRFEEKKIKNAKETLQQNGFERFHGKNQCDVWDKDFFPTRLEVPEPDDEQLVKAKAEAQAHFFRETIFHKDHMKISIKVALF